VSNTLVVDIGNSRMKWAVVGPRGTLAAGIVPNAELGSLAVRDWQGVPRPARAVGVNVAGEAARVRVEGQLARWRLPMEWITATASACGVVNRYEQPGQLGPDRWAALVAARLRSLEQDSEPRPVVVVNAGTAVTIDTLDAAGVFRGGMILPNMRLMMRALADHTAALKVAPGRRRDLHGGALCGVRRDRARARSPRRGRRTHPVLHRGRRGARSRSISRRSGGARG